MNKIIKDIYYGNILPFEEAPTEPLKAKEKAEHILQIHNEILEAFPNAEELLESYRTVHYDSAEYYGCQQFQLGMRLGAQLMMELMSPFERQ